MTAYLIYKTSSYVPELKAGNKCMAFGDFSYYWVAISVPPYDVLVVVVFDAVSGL